MTSFWGTLVRDSLSGPPHSMEPSASRLSSGFATPTRRFIAPTSALPRFVTCFFPSVSSYWLLTVPVFGQFFQTLYICLTRGAKAVFQFYPENSLQIEMITNAAMKAGFTGGLIVDYPNSSKKKKYFLCLFAGVVAGQNASLPRALDEGDEPNSAHFTDERERGHQRKQRRHVKERDWILKKKETNRKRGKTVPEDSKFTGRKRGPRF